jgi:hypothetical protein
VLLQLTELTLLVLMHHALLILVPVLLMQLLQLNAQQCYLVRLRFLLGLLLENLLLS